MKVIYKYNVEDKVVAPIKRFLDAQVQNNNFVVWAELDDSLPVHKYRFSAVWTGMPYPDNGIYIGTFQYNKMVYHIYAIEM